MRIIKKIYIGAYQKKTKQNTPFVGKMLPPTGKCFSEILPSTECYFQLLPYLQGLSQQIAPHVCFGGFFTLDGLPSSVIVHALKRYVSPFGTKQGSSTC